MKGVFIALCLFVILCWSARPVLSRSFDDCSSKKCNSSDPNCDPIGRRCKDGYRRCCDQICHDKREPCEKYRPPENNRNASFNYDVETLNATAYKEHLEMVKEMIRKFAAEKDCWPTQKCINETTCMPEYHHCENSGQCVALLSDCTMWWENQDYSQTRNATCYPDDRCFRNHCLTHYWMCDNGECVHEQLVCRGGANCDDGSDETKCSGECYPPFRCENNTCKYGFHECSDGKCVLQEQVCDAIEDCVDGCDERACSTICYPEKACNSDGTCKDGYFRCDGAKCIPVTDVCDHRKNCKDGTDEIRSGPGFKCVLGKHFGTCVLPQQYIENSQPKCADHSDNCFVNGTNRCFTCLDQKLIIAEKQKCDGVFDCLDLSDECLCENSLAEEACQSVCGELNASNRPFSQDTFPFVLKHCNCSVGKFDCGNGVCLKKDQVCDGKNDCGVSNLDEKFCQAVSKQNEYITLCPGDVYNTTMIEAILCDGRPECHDLSDECNDMCDSKPLFCNIKDTFFESESGPYEFLCDKTSLFFDVGDICDGMWTKCEPRIDEEEEGCPARFYCKNGDAISIDVNLLCDGMPQCDDNSDEDNCPERFYCEDGVPYSVPISNMLDGKKDCNDNSDECPKEMDKNALSSRSELLGSTGFRVTTWIIGIVAVIGNILTFAGAAKALIQIKGLNPVSKINYVFLLNLAVADCLMGFYLLSLSVKSLHFSGSYCMYDKAWRTGPTCAGLGSLALMSSQASVIILVALTTLRLYSVMNPIKTKDFSMLLPLLTMFFAWFASMLIGLLPISPNLSDYFVSEIWMTTNFTNMEARNNTAQAVFVHRLADYKPVSDPIPDTTSWNALEEFVTNNYPEFNIKGYFGYFSDNSVCLPKFFVSVGEAGWEYSVGIILFNFLAFFYVCIAYWVIFRVSSNRHSNKMRSKQLVNMQKRVARLVITDFFCWIPICLMSFIQLGGINVPDFAYAFSAVILLPINSAINPFLYSNILAQPLERLYTMIFSKKAVRDITPCNMKTKRAESFPNHSDDEDYAEQQSEETEERSI